jgi:hypothetical protein
MCQECEHERFVRKINDLLEDNRFEFAEDTLRGILDWITGNEHITERQKTAVLNIEASKEK